MTSNAVSLLIEMEKAVDGHDDGSLHHTVGNVYVCWDGGFEYYGDLAGQQVLTRDQAIAALAAALGETPPTANLNANQRTLLTVYAGGEWAHLIEEIETKVLHHDEIAEWADDLIEERCGDTLLLFLWRELRTDGDTSQDAYVGRLQVAITDIEAVLAHL